jgi:adenylyltransferase/sulfurtransferase
MSEPLSREEITRYSRHLLLPEVSAAGQARLKAARALVVGAGGLGSPAALYLAAAGVGRIGLADFDAVDVSNLQRQVLYGTQDVGRAKVDAARERLTALNPHVDVAVFRERLTKDNVRGVFEGFDVVLDGTDNFATRYLTNDACFLLGKPNVYGSIYRFEGQVSVFHRGHGPCYRCLYPSPPDPGLVPSCAEGGVLGVLPGVIGALQATEALKLLLGIGRSLAGRLLVFEALSLSFREIALTRDPGCPLCGERPSITDLVDYDALCASGAAILPEGAEMTAVAVRAWRDEGHAFQLLDVREPAEAAIAAIAGSVLVPLGSLSERIGEVDRTRPVVVYCRSGTRSARAVALLRGAGLSRTYNLAGGILAWARDVDPGLPL